MHTKNDTQFDRMSLSPSRIGRRRPHNHDTSNSFTHYNKTQLSKIFKTPNAVIGKLPEAKYTHTFAHTQLHRKNKQSKMNFFSKKFPSVVEIFHFWAIENCYRDGAENEKNKNGAELIQYSTHSHSQSESSGAPGHWKYVS